MALKEERRLSQSGGHLKLELPDEQLLSTEKHENSESQQDEGLSITLKDFRKLLNEQDFTDFFNKFICLPAFAQLAVYSRKRKQFIFHPPLPNHCTVNNSGLLEWLWENRLKLFLKSRFFGEYRLCSSLVRLSLIREQGVSFEDEVAKTVHHSLKWLKKRYLGRVAGIRKFRSFLNQTKDGCNLYHYCLDFECLYFHVTRRSTDSTEVFHSIRDKYFSGTSESKISQHFLNEASEMLSQKLGSRNVAVGPYSVAFAVCLHRIFIRRMKYYWMPRFLLDQNPSVNNEQEALFLDLAKKYLRGAIKLMPHCTTQEVANTDIEEHQDLKDLEDLVEEDLSSQGENDDASEEADDLFDNNSVQQESATDWISNDGQSRESRRKEVSFQEHPPPGVSRSQEKEEGEDSTDISSETSSSDDDEHGGITKRRYSIARKRVGKTPDGTTSGWRRKSVSRTPDSKRRDSTARAPSGTSESSKSNSRGQTASMTPESENMHSRRRTSSTTPDANKPQSRKQTTRKNSETKEGNSRKQTARGTSKTKEGNPRKQKKTVKGKGEAFGGSTGKARKNSKDGQNSADSSDGSDTAESWEGVQDIHRSNKGKKKFRFKGRHRDRSIQKRKIKFEEFLTKESFRQSVSKAEKEKLAEEAKKAANQTNPQDGLNSKPPVPDANPTRPSGHGNADPSPEKAPKPTKVPGKKLRKLSTVSKANIQDARVNDTLNHHVKEKSSHILATSSLVDDSNLPKSTLTREVSTEDHHSPRRMSEKRSDFSSVDSCKSSRANLFGNMKQIRENSSGLDDALCDSAASFDTIPSSPKRKFKPIPKVKEKRKKLAKFTFSLAEDAPVPVIKPKRKPVIKKPKPDNAGKAVRKVSKPRRKKKKLILPSIPVAISVVSSHEYTIAKDNAYRSQPENLRMILALQADQCAAQPFHAFLLATDNVEMVHYLEFWLEVEKTRQDFQFGTMTFACFVRSMNKIVRLYLLRSSPSRIEAPDSLRDETIMCCLSPTLKEMPWQIRKLQKEVMEDLKQSHQSFYLQETESFKNSAVIGDAQALDQEERKLSIRASGLLFPPVLNTTKMPSSKILSEDKSSYEMDFRMSRSLRYIIQINLPDGRNETSANNIDGESDDDGCPPTFPKPTNFREVPIDYKELASRSAKQYPDEKTLAKINRRRNDAFGGRYGSDAFDPMLRRDDTYMTRPLIRPKYFHEVLKDPIHFQFFKRFLKAHRADIPLTFWKAVETLRISSKTKSKPYRVQHIANKYFFNSKMPATKLLQCKADIIKEIPYVSLVTASMLFTAQQLVARVLKEKWFSAYANTFEDPEPLSLSDETNDNTYPMRTLLSPKERLKSAWQVFTDFIRRISAFLRSMKKPKMFHLFNNFLLKKMNEINRECAAKDNELPLELVAGHSETSSIPFNITRTDDEKSELKQSIINGNVVIFNFLSNDLHFWRDIECYRKIYRGFRSETKRSRDFNREETVLRTKANLIVSCYLVSDVKPKIRVNIPAEVADITIESLNDGLVDQTLFHEAIVYIFPLLLHFWSKFCAEHYRYVPTLSKRYRLIYGFKMTPMIAEAHREEVKRKARLRNGLLDSGDSMAETKKMKNPHRVDTADLPNYLDLNEDKFARAKGSPFSLADEMSPRLTFSIRKGVTLIQPVRRLTYAFIRGGNNFPSPPDSPDSASAKQPLPDINSNEESKNDPSALQVQEIEPISDIDIPKSMKRRPGILNTTVLRNFRACQGYD